MTSPFDSVPARLVKPIVFGGPTGTVYRLPAGFGNDDLNHPADPPNSLGDFWPHR